MTEDQLASVKQAGINKRKQPVSKKAFLKEVKKREALELQVKALFEIVKESTKVPELTESEEKKKLYDLAKDKYDVKLDLRKNLDKLQQEFKELEDENDRS